MQSISPINSMDDNNNSAHNDINIDNAMDIDTDMDYVHPQQPSCATSSTANASLTKTWHTRGQQCLRWGITKWGVSLQWHTNTEVATCTSLHQDFIHFLSTWWQHLSLYSMGTVQTFSGISASLTAPPQQCH